MVTDYEGFPEQLYCECGSTFESIFNWMHLESYDRAKVEYLMEWQGASFSDALESFEDVILWEYSGSKSDAVYYIFHELYPDVENIERQNDFLTVDYDRFEDQCLIDFADSEGNEYLVLRE